MQASLVSTLKNVDTTRYNNNRRCSSGVDSPSECYTPVPSDGEVDDKSSDGERSASNYHVETFYKIPKKRRLIEATDVGHKSPVVKNRKSLVEHGLGMRNSTSSNPQNRMVIFSMFVTITS
jgi:hypothetical protein